MWFWSRSPLLFRSCGPRHLGWCGGTRGSGPSSLRCGVRVSGLAHIVVFLLSLVLILVKIYDCSPASVVTMPCSDVSCLL